MKGGRARGVGRWGWREAVGKTFTTRVSIANQSLIDDGKY